MNKRDYLHSCTFTNKNQTRHYKSDQRLKCRKNENLYLKEGFWLLGDNLLTQPFRQLQSHQTFLSHSSTALQDQQLLLQQQTTFPSDQLQAQQQTQARVSTFQLKCWGNYSKYPGGDQIVTVSSQESHGEHRILNIRPEGKDISETNVQ